MKAIINTFDNFTNFYRILILSGIVVAVSVGFYNLSNNALHGVIAVIVVVLVLWATQNLWTPKEYRKPIIAYSSLIGFGTASLTIIAGFEKLAPVIQPVFDIFLPLANKAIRNYTTYESLVITTDLMKTTVITIVLLIFLLINYIFKKNTIVLPHSIPLSTDFPELDFKKKLVALSNGLENELLKIDKETNWSDYYFIPIDAEVEIYNNYSKEKKVTDLMKALKNNKKTRAFLVLGDPGAGKSVALRKLGKELIKEVEKTGRVPIYLRAPLKTKKVFQSSNHVTFVP